ncbi:MAG: DUF1223 domain-containing protein, partial [Pseudomonadota bacterium]
MRTALVALSALVSLTVGAVSPAPADPVVVELFTSQGCSSCPPADAMLGELAERDDVIALSLHVDYWDWIGWADTFAAADYTARQRAYAEAAGTSVVYTPQFIIGGVDQVAGPSAMELVSRISAHQDATGDVLEAVTGANGGIAIAADAAGVPARLVLVELLPQATVKIGRGENAGREMTYHNVVRDWRVLADWDGSAVTIDLPDAAEGNYQVVLAQTMADGKPGPV